MKFAKGLLLSLFFITCSFSGSAQNAVNLSSGKNYEFLEGPVWDGNNTLYFTDIVKRLIVKYNTSTKTFTTIASNTQSANGMMFNTDNNLVVCEGNAGSVNERDVNGSILKTYTSSYEGKSFNSPNDLCLDSKGGIYFSDPTWSPPVQPKNRVYYLDPSGNVMALIDDMERPNGVLLSQDGQTLFVNDSWSPEVRAYDVETDGSISNERVFASLEMPDGELIISGADGMALDKSGNLYVTSEVGIQVYNPQGTRIQKLLFPEQTSNCTFGGPDMNTLYVTARKNLYSIQLTEEGVRHPFDLTTPLTPTNEEISKEQIKIFPNPATESFRINSSTDVVSFSLLDASGQELLTENINSKQHEINTTILDNGLYLLTLRMADGTTLSKRLVKK